MKAFIIVFLITGMLFFSSGCSKPDPGVGEDTPTGAYKRLYAAVKSKDIEAIKAIVTKKSNDLAAMASERNKNPIEKVYANGFTATTFSETLPTIRDERIDGDMGAVEVWNSKESKWEDLPFIKEDGGWKLAVGDMFAGTYKSPGLGRDIREKEAANAVANNAIPIAPTSNTNAPIPITNANAIPPPSRKEGKAK